MRGHGIWAALCGLTLPALVCHAEGAWSGSIAAATDYIYRGVSQTYDSAALQLGGNYQNPFGWFAGAWGSNVNPYPHGGASVELNLYTGITRPIGTEFSARLAYTHYMYLDDPRRAHYDYDELSLSAAYLDRLALTLSYDPDYTNYSQLGYAERRPSESAEITGRWPLYADFDLTAGTGYYSLQQLFRVGYWAGSVGVAYVFHKRLTLEVDRFFAQGIISRLYEDQSSDGTWALTALLRF